MPKFTPQHWKTIEAVFLGAGFRFDRQEGSHRSYIKPGVARPVVIPAYREVPVFVIRNNLKTAGISRDEYFALLQKAK
jgi:predicted RNA binding protein YcfA (HicA-like mRNA interferase family)